MIISTDQILKCLHYLSAPDSREQTNLGTHPEGGGKAGPHGLSPEIRTVRIKSLRELLSGDGYDIPPEMLADKMIGRALCDQISGRYEKSADRTETT